MTLSLLDIGRLGPLRENRVVMASGNVAQNLPLLVTGSVPKNVISQLRILHITSNKVKPMTTYLERVTFRDLSGEIRDNAWDFDAQSEDALRC